MSIFLTLANNDVKAVKSWFETQTISKILVFSGFALIFLGVSGCLFYSSNWIFTILKPLQIYGRLTAEYLIRAAILVTFWLGVGSSTAATINIFSTRNRNNDYLISLPIKAADLAFWYIIKTITANAILITIFVLPLIIPFAQVFQGNNSWIILVKAIFEILALAVITTSVGGGIALLIIKNRRGHSLVTNIFLISGFLLIMALLFKLVFPADLLYMSSAPPEVFLSLYNRLPLANQMLPSSFMAAVITEGSLSSWLLTLGFTLIIFIPYFIWIRNIFIGLYQITLQQVFTGSVKTGSKNTIAFHRISPEISLAEKDLASVIRSPTESGYGLFLLLLLAAFFGLFSRIKPDLTGQQEWLNRLVIFSFLGLAFFANTYYLRLVFPLMAKEAESVWYIFTLPVSRIKIWKQKLILGLVISYPLILLSLILWWIIPFAYPYQLILTGTSLWLVLLLPVIHTFMGAVYPDFTQGNDPEKVSTSSMGILTLVISLGVIGIFSLGLSKYINGAITLAGLVGIFLFISLLAIFIGGKMSINNTEKYEFPRT